MSTKPSFRSPQGIYYTKGLFFETTLSDKSTVIYTLKNEDHEGYPSLYQLYMGMNDLTEWKFANEYLGGWEHWQKLCECSWFKDYINRWREELELKVRAEALSRIQTEARTNSKNAFTANKFLVDRGWKTPEEKKNPVGRPTKEAIARKAKELTLDGQDIDSDYERLLVN